MIASVLVGRLQAMHEAVAVYCRKWADTLPGHGLDIGGRDLNGHPRGLWPETEWTVIDLRPAPGVDIVADAANWTPDRRYDVVLCTEVLEHAEDWQDIVSVAAAALAPAGRLVITCAAPGRAPHSGIEATVIQPGEYYRNIPHPELAVLLEGLGLIVDDCRQTGFDTQAAARRKTDDQFAQGGIVGKGVVTARLSPGEKVLTAADQRNLLRMIAEED